MKTRRSFLKTSAQVSAYTFFYSQLIACKSGAKIIDMPPLNIASDAAYKMQVLRGNVGYFTERGGTIGWMASKNGVVVIDTQFPEQSQNLLAELTKLSSHPLDLLINTHHHGDHTSGNPVYKDLTNKILAHENSKKNQMKVAEARDQKGQVFPTHTFKDTHTEKVGNETIKMYYFGPGHTDGDAVTHLETTNVVHMGDLVFNRRFPYIDKSAGANIANWIKVLDNTTNTFNNETKYIFGHSGEGYDIIGNAEDIKAFKNYLEKLLVFGEQSIAAGKTLEELKASVKEIPGAPEWKDGSIGRSLDAVYEELK